MNFCYHFVILFNLVTVILACADNPNTKDNQIPFPVHCADRIKILSNRADELKAFIQQAFEHIALANTEIVINASAEWIADYQLNKHRQLERVKQSADEKFASYKLSLAKVYERNDCPGTREPIDRDVKRRAIELDGYVGPFITKMMNIRDDLQAYANDIVPAVYTNCNQQHVGTTLHTLLLNRFHEYCTRVKVYELSRNMALITANVGRAVDNARQTIAQSRLISEWKVNLDRWISEALHDFYREAEKMDICKIIDSLKVVKEADIIQIVKVNVDHHKRQMHQLAHRLIMNLKTISDSAKSIGLIVSHHIIAAIWRFDPQNHCERTQWHLLTRRKYNCSTNKREEEIELFLEPIIVNALFAFLPQPNAVPAIRTKSRQLIQFIQRQLDIGGKLSIVYYLVQRHTADDEMVVRGYLQYMLWRECENFIVRQYRLGSTSGSGIAPTPLPPVLPPFDPNKYSHGLDNHATGSQ